MGINTKYVAGKKDIRDIQWIVDMWKSYQCAPCRNGDRSKCGATLENAMAFVEKPNGEREYFCFAGCMLLRVLEIAGYNGLNKVICQQFDEEGHYEKLRNG
jgi:hypothetical protein